jgi:Ca2+-binding EF-hand superfamily protein
LNLEVRAMRDRDRTTLDYVRPGAEQRGRLREDFDFNDLNRDGRLTLGEFIRFMRNVDEDITPEELQIGFDEIDTNRDGRIDFEEFVAWWNDRA